jgi:glutamyl-tRNA synthetase
MDKLNFVNQEHLKRLDPASRREIIEPFWRSLGLSPERREKKYLEDALSLMGGRGRTTKELAEFSDYFVDFGPVKERYDASEISTDRRLVIRKFLGELLSSPEWEAPKMEKLARNWCETNKTSLKDVAMPLRLALTGRKVSPGVFEVAALLGRDECRARLTHYGLVE